MNKTILLVALLSLGAYTSVQAQSDGASKGQAGAGPVNHARKANTSQTQGKGVPYSKDKEQQQGRAAAKGGTPSASGSSTSGQGNTTSGKKSGTKPGNSQSGTGNN